MRTEPPEPDMGILRNTLMVTTAPSENKRLAWEILGCEARQEASEFLGCCPDDHEPAWDDDFLEGFAGRAIDVF